MKTKIIVCLLFLALFVYAGSALAFTESTSSTFNDYFGYSAGGTGGTYNSFFGKNAGNFNTGSNNTFVGYNSGVVNNTGGSNTFIGESSGQSNTTGISNTFIGQRSGQSNTTGNYNTFIGRGSGWNNSTGNSNVFIGVSAGANETGSDKLYIDNSNTSSPLIYGDFAADTLTINGALTATSLSGDGSGLTNITPAQAGAVNLTGDTMTGALAVQANIDTSTEYSIDGTPVLVAENLNTFIGKDSGNSSTTGDSNTFIGKDSGNAITWGFRNTFLGEASGRSNTTGSLNTFIGEDSGQSNTTGNSNTFIGRESGTSNNTGFSNTFVGKSSGVFNTTGYFNTFLGEASGWNNSTGNSNVFLGYQAGYNETGSNKLYIDNSSTATPLIYGDFTANTLTINGALTATSLSGGGSGLTGVVASDANLLDGLDSSAFATSAHAHAGADITSGTVADAWIASTIARDSEIMTTVLANDGSGSTLDADLLDGLDSTAFMSSSTDNWVDTTGDTMTGDLIVEGSVEIDFDLFVNGNTYVDSDKNLKKDIAPIESSLEKIKNIQGVSFAWKESEQRDRTRTEGRHYGVIAQNVEQVLPEIVKEGKNSTKKVAYMELIPVLIEAIKEQQKKDMEQSQVIKEQQKIISKLAERLNDLEREVKLKGSLASVTK